MEQITPIFKLLSERLLGVEITGSEYVDATAVRGQDYKGVRHEDAEALSFSDNSFDYVVSNEVFEQPYSRAEVRVGPGVPRQVLDGGWLAPGVVCPACLSGGGRRG